MGAKKYIVSKEVALAMMSGMVAILIANASNPYLDKLGCMWMIYFPFAIAQYVDNKRGGN